MFAKIMSKRNLSGQLGLRLNPEILERIKKDAAEEQLDMSDIARRAINKYYQDKDDGIKA